MPPCRIPFRSHRATAERAFAYGCDVSLHSAKDTVLLLTGIVATSTGGMLLAPLGVEMLLAAERRLRRGSRCATRPWADRTAVEVAPSNRS